SVWPERLIDIPTVHDIADNAIFPIPIAKSVEEAQDVLDKIRSHRDLVDQAIHEADKDLLQAAKTLQRVLGDDEATGFPLPEVTQSSRSGPTPFAKPRSRSDVTEAPPFG